MGYSKYLSILKSFFKIQKYSPLFYETKLRLIQNSVMTKSILLAGNPLCVRWIINIEMNLKNIIEIVKQKNRVGQKILYERYVNTFFRLSFRYVKKQNDAEDCVMEAFMKIFEGLQQFDYQSDIQTEAWMKRIVVNQSLKCLRKRNALLIIDFQENIL